MRKWFLIPVMLVVFAVGCAPSLTTIAPITTASSVILSPSAEVTTLPIMETPSSGSWAGPMKVIISNFHPGATAVASIQIHNGWSQPQQFSLAWQYPDFADESYRAKLPNLGKWVTITDPNPVIKPDETRSIEVDLVMPDGATAPKEWEFWISVLPCSNAPVQFIVASRWLVSMRQ